MLLTCCFRDKKTKKHKKNASRKQSVPDTEEIPAASSGSLRTGPGRKLEKYPPSKEEKRLLKQRSQEVLADTVSSVSSIVSRKESLPSPPGTPDGRRSSSLLLASSPPKQGDTPLLTSTPATAGQGTSYVPAVETTIGNISEIRRSSGFCEGQFSEEQMEEDIKRRKKNENIIEETKKSHSMMIQTLKEDHALELDAARVEFEQELKKVMQHLKEHNDNIITNAKNEANDKITKLNQQIVLERTKMIAEQQEMSRNLEAEFRLKEDQLNNSMEEIAAREQAWQEERADVLKEVQRLKAEASRMVKILALEYEDEEHLSEDRKRSLSQEVYSLQLVVEMRTGEVRNLREQMVRAMQQQEQAMMDREKLRKVTARMEDLEEQLRIKTCLERELSLEKSQLCGELAHSAREADRMNKTMESLRWRIRNNFHLPIQNTSDDQKSDSNYITASTHTTTAISDDAIEQLGDKENYQKHAENEGNIIKSTSQPDSDKNKIDDFIGDVNTVDEGVGDICSYGENHDRLPIDNTISESVKKIDISIECETATDKIKKSSRKEKERIASFI